MYYRISTAGVQARLNVTSWQARLDSEIHRILERAPKNIGAIAAEACARMREPATKIAERWEIELANQDYLAHSRSFWRRGNRGPRTAQSRNHGRAPRRVGIRVARRVTTSSSGDDSAGGDGEPAPGDAGQIIFARCASNDWRLPNAA